MGSEGDGVGGHIGSWEIKSGVPSHILYSFIGTKNVEDHGLRVKVRLQWKLEKQEKSQLLRHPNS